MNTDTLQKKLMCELAKVYAKYISAYIQDLVKQDDVSIEQLTEIVSDLKTFYNHCTSKDITNDANVSPKELLQNNIAEPETLLPAVIAENPEAEEFTQYPIRLCIGKSEYVSKYAVGLLGQVAFIQILHARLNGLAKMCSTEEAANIRCGLTPIYVGTRLDVTIASFLMKTQMRKSKLFTETEIRNSRCSSQDDFQTFTDVKIWNQFLNTEDFKFDLLYTNTPNAQVTLWVDERYLIVKETLDSLYVRTLSNDKTYVRFVNWTGITLSQAIKKIQRMIMNPHMPSARLLINNDFEVRSDNQAVFEIFKITKMEFQKNNQ